MGQRRYGLVPTPTARVHRHRSSPTCPPAPSLRTPFCLPSCTRSIVVGPTTYIRPWTVERSKRRLSTNKLESRSPPRTQRCLRCGLLRLAFRVLNRLAAGQSRVDGVEDRIEVEVEGRGGKGSKAVFGVVTTVEWKLDRAHPAAAGRKGHGQNSSSCGSDRPTGRSRLTRSSLPLRNEFCLAVENFFIRWVIHAFLAPRLVFTSFSWIHYAITSMDSASSCSSDHGSEISTCVVQVFPIHELTLASERA